MHTRTGIFREHKGFHSHHLPDDRDILVYLPPDYESALVRRYPVLYLHDGQNVFDAETAFAGHEWRADETAEALIRAGEIEPIIMVGIYNTGVRRVEEYTPTRDVRRQSGGQADRYAQMIVEELKPFIDREYRTMPDRANTGMAGSSLGGLVTLYIGIKRPDVFGKLAALSPSVWWGGRAILDVIRHAPEPSVRPRIWVDVGAAEGPEYIVEDVPLLRDLLVERGWMYGRDLSYLEAVGAGHNEQAWAARMNGVLLFLFGRDPA